MVQASDYEVGIDDGHSPYTAGKRTPFISSLGRQIRENEFNKPVVNLLEKELKRCGFRTLQLAPTDADTPLSTRTNTANRAKVDLLISIHFNAIGNTFGYSSAKGFSVHIQPTDKSNPNSGSLKFAKFAIEELSKGTAQTNRGIVGQNLHMTRESNMPAALIECGFMDNEKEALLMVSPAFQIEVAQELAKATCRYFGVVYVYDKPVVKPVAKEEEEEMLEKAIVIHSLQDFVSAEVIASRLKIPVYTRVSIKGEVAKELIIVGGDAKGLKAVKITNLAGKDRFATAANVAKYLK